MLEKQGGRVTIKSALIEVVRSHYDDISRIHDDIKRLGFPGAAQLLRERLPTRTNARSGELGEIIAATFVEFATPFRIPVRRLRYKDGREMALRGDDYIGILESPDKTLHLLKGEAKSRTRLTTPVIAAARAVLSSHDGRPTPISVLFVADRLMESDGTDVDLGRRLRDHVATQAIRSDQITHALFVLSANAPNQSIENDLETADQDHHHISACMLIDDHQAFIRQVYEEAGNLGDH